MIVLGILIFVGVGALYAGIGWGIAWILEVALSVDVNYTIFVLVALGLFLLKASIGIFSNLYFHKKEREFDKKFKEFDKHIDRF